MQDETSRSFFMRIFGFLTRGRTKPSMTTLVAPLAGDLPAEATPMLASLAETTEAIVAQSAAEAIDGLDIAVANIDAASIDTNPETIGVHPVAAWAGSQQTFLLAQRLKSVERLNRPSSRAAQRPTRLAPAGKPIPKSASGKRAVNGGLRPIGRLIAPSVAFTPAPQVAATAEILLFPRSKVRLDVAAA